MIGWIIITTIDTNGSWRICHRTSIMSTLQQESIHWRELFAAMKTNIYSLKQIYKNVLDKGYSLEFGDDEIPEIMNHLSQPVISSIRMEPGQTNRDKIEKQSEEDNHILFGKNDISTEGSGVYQIRI